MIPLPAEPGRTYLLSIDPGNVESGWAVVDDTYLPVAAGITDNDAFVAALPALVADYDIDLVTIEMIQSFGMAVGATVFETVFWIGVFHTITSRELGCRTERVYRQKVKLHHTHMASAKDANVKAAIVDRFCPGARNHGRGLKDDPTWFYDFKDDMWQAYALAVYTLDVVVPQHRGAESVDAEAWIPDVVPQPRPARRSATHTHARVRAVVPAGRS